MVNAGFLTQFFIPCSRACPFQAGKNYPPSMNWRTTPCLHGEFCWHEVSTGDVEGSTAFYAPLLNAKATAIPMPNGNSTLLAIGSHPVLGITPSREATPLDIQAHWVGYIAVDDIDQATARAAELGATVRSPVTQGAIGRWSLITDPTGAAFALFQADPEKTDGKNNFGPGAVVWNHLVTPDPARAVEFYSALLGWTSELPPDGGDDGARRMNAYDRSVAGVMPTSHPDDRAAWLPFIEVERIEDAARTAVQLGATALTEVFGFPSIGAVMVLKDPQGATVCVLEPAKREEQ